jgi:hypothetical protein
MKLIFLGDSFSEGVGIDIEYGIQKGLIKNNSNSYYFDRSEFEFNTRKIIKNFQENNCWPILLSKEIKNEVENFSRGASGADLLFLQLLESEKKNKNIKRFYIICLPKLSQGRIMISNEKNFSIKNLLYFFNPIVFNTKQKDIDFYKKYFDKNFFYMYYLNFLMSIINYLKNKKVGFLFLPTWEPTIEKHFFDEENIEKKHFFNKENIEKKNILNAITKEKKQLLYNRYEEFLRDHQDQSNQQNNSYFMIESQITSNEIKNEMIPKIKEQTLFNYYERFFFNELKDQMNFKINHNDLTFLPCDHADIKSQYLIKDIYKNYILEKVK